MKILKIGKGWFPEEPGGLNRYFYDCVQSLPSVGIDIEGLVAGSDRTQSDSSGLVQAFSDSSSHLFLRWLRLRRLVPDLLKINDIPLVVSHFGLYTFPILNQLGDRPLVVHFHGPWALEGKAEGGKALAVYLKKQLEQLCYQHAVVFIVLSKAFQEILHKEYNIPLERIQIVPGGVDLKHFDISYSQQEAREKMGWDADRPTAVTVRRLAKRMGLENLIQAILYVKNKHPDIMLKIVGKGSLQNTLKQQIEKFELSQNIELLGYVSDEQLPLIYRAADFSIVPTTSLEGFGLTVVESLAAGTPVLGTPIGGIPEILHPFSSDLVLEGSAPEHLTRGINEVLLGVRKLPSSQACQEYVRQHYSWPVIAQNLKAIYIAATNGRFE